MAEARVLLALAALLIIALWYISRGVPQGVAPFFAVGSAAMCVVLFGCFGLLWFGGALVYIAAAAAAAQLCYAKLRRGTALPKPGFAFWFFAAASLCFIILLWLKQPMFTGWDEFSLWGTAAKLMKLYNELYTTAPIGWIWTASQTPALMSFAYFFQFFGEGFAEWQVYAAYDVFLMAAVAAVLAPFEKKDWNVAVPLALIGLLTPYVFQHYASVTRVSQVYLDSLADIPLGFAFAAALCIGFGVKKHTKWSMAALCTALATLTLTKDIGFALALVVCVLLVINDIAFAGKKTLAERSVIKGMAVRAAAMFGAVIAAFVGWSAYLGSVAEVDRLQSLGGTTGAGMLELPLLFVGDLLSPEKSEFFVSVTTGMVSTFVYSQNTMLGSGLMVVLGILAMVAIAAALAKEPADRRRCICFGVFSLLGFCAYYALITMTYLYIFRPEQALAFESYERYIYPYYIGWFLCAAMLLAKYAARRTAKAEAIGKALVLALAAGLLVRFAMLVPLQHTIFGVHSSMYEHRRMFESSVQQLQNSLEPDGRTFYVESNDNGIGWFTYSYQLLPWQLDYSYGGGPLQERELLPSGEVATHTVSAEEWAQYLQDSGCTTVYIEYADQEFKQMYGGLFSDGMQAYDARQTRIYEVAYDGGGELTLLPMLEGLA